LTATRQGSRLALVPCSVICISYATGSDGDEVGRLVAERLGFLHVDEEIVARAAARGGVSPADVADEERRRSLATRVLRSISDGGSNAMALGGGALPLVPDDEPDSREVQALIREAIEQTAGHGSVVITAHGASHALEPGAGTLRVLVTASPATRCRRISERAAVDIARAKRSIKAADAGRRDYLKRFYGVTQELPTHYDLVVNTDGMSVEEAAALLVHVAKARSSLPAPA
jgi:cytidylate kinase